MDRELDINKRRGLKSWLIEPYRQVQVGIVLVLLNLFFSVLVLSVFSYYFWDVYNSLSLYFELSKSQENEILSKLLIPIYISFSLVFAFVVLTILVSLKYTHKIYGPLIAINRFLDDLLQEKTPAPLVLRDGDQLHDLAKKLNALLNNKRSLK